jgi:hypothetical protein
MIVQLKKKNSRYRDLTLGQPYAVIGIEADDYRILNDAGRPFLYPKTLFTKIDPEEPSDWLTEFGDDQERYSYPSALNKPGFFEDFFDEKPTAVATFWHLVNQGLPSPSRKGRSTGLADRGSFSPSISVSDWDMHVYAEAGLALRWAQLFEGEIVTVVLVYGVSRQQFSVRSEAEDFVRKAEKKPLSQLLHDVLKRVKFEPDITPTFEEAISARNSLVHRFFWDRSETFAEETDQSKLLKELRDLTLLFFSAYKFAEMLRNLYVQQLDETQIQKIRQEMSSLPE